VSGGLVGKKQTFPSLKFPRQCPTIILVKKCRREGKTLGSEEGKVMEGNNF
jgi:hypothetical protein